MAAPLMSVRVPIFVGVSLPSRRSLKIVVREMRRCCAASDTEKSSRSTRFLSQSSSTQLRVPRRTRKAICEPGGQRQLKPFHLRAIYC